MNDSAIFQGLTRAWSSGTPPTMAPMTQWKNMFFDCPMAVASHLQRFMGKQAQEQMQLMGELAKEPNPANAMTKELAFMQQSALAWNTEVLELAELIQTKVLAATQPETNAEKPPVAEAA
ncbi:MULTISPECIES: hypothetical protein [unclassified Xanthobacter]|uniref:hypothetical protein n=1 Tax=unclassified Xanthobacter TaxID=2623496 RepID=UPI001EDE0519|nr:MULTISPECIES: hypothetical protein [unclassified Xanthobacter]